MKDQKNLCKLWLVGLLLAAIFMVCLVSGLLSGGLLWLRGKLDITAQVGQFTSVGTGTLSRLKSTATLPISAMPARTGAFTPTLTSDWLTGTQPVTVTFAPLTATLTLSATQFMVEPSSTPAPALSSWCLPLNTLYQNARVLQVIDGVSIEVELDGMTYAVRYLGIDLPDPQIGSPDWSRALQRNRELVESRVVLLVRDRSQSDAQGQLLRYVISEGIFVNRELVESGYAMARSVLPDVSCATVLQQAEQRARTALLGVWGPTPTPTRTLLPPTATLATTGDVRIAYLKYWGVGWQDPNEYVEIRNDSSWPVQLQDWTLSDVQGRQFVFPSFVLTPGAYCRVYTHKYVPGVCNFSFYHPAEIWDDEGDCAYLKDALGNLVDKLCYE